jgi:hypothetical protein
VIIFLYSLTVISSASVLTADPDRSKMSASLARKAANADTGEEGVFWVFFSEKGYRNDSERKAMLQEARKRISERSLNRRAMRCGGRPSVDELDIAVYPEYVNAVCGSGVEHRATSRWLNAISVRCTYRRLSELSAFSFVTELREIHPTQKRTIVEPIDALHPFSTSPFDSTEYGLTYDQLKQINVPAVHDLGYDGSGILVCMLDTGYERTHPAIAAQVVEAEWDFINDDGDTSYDPEQDDPRQPFHGSITMCTVGGYEPDTYIAPAYNSHFILAKTEDTEDERPIEEDWWVEGIEWGDELGADVASSSLGYTDWYEFEDLDGNTAVTTIAADIAAMKGIVVVTAAGNERGSSWNHIICPADGDSVIAAGAVDSLGFLASFSSPGPTYDDRIKPEVCARGVGTYCAYPFDNSSYIQASGTSLSTPLVAGAVALILQAHPCWSPLEVRQALMETADNAGSPDNNYGWGIIDVLAAINWNTDVQMIRLSASRESNTTVRLSWSCRGDALSGFKVMRICEDGGRTRSECITGDAILNGYAHVDGNAPSSAGLQYQIEGVDSLGRTVVKSNLCHLSPAEGVRIRSPFVIADTNPFNPLTTIRYTVPASGDAGSVAVKLCIYDVRGGIVKTLFQGSNAPGEYRVTWHGESDGGTRVSTGVYYCRYTCGNDVATVKLLMMK